MTNVYLVLGIVEAGRRPPTANRHRHNRTYINNNTPQNHTTNTSTNQHPTSRVCPLTVTWRQSSSPSRWQPPNLHTILSFSDYRAVLHPRHPSPPSQPPRIPTSETTTSSDRWPRRTPTISPILAKIPNRTPPCSVATITTTSITTWNAHTVRRRFSWTAVT